MNEETARFRGTAALYGMQGLKILRNSSLTMAGIGGVGSWAAEAAVRAGIGRIRLLDHDVVSLTNCNRQLHAMSSTLGKPKVEVLAARLRDISPDLAIRTERVLITADNIQELFPAQDAGGEFVIEAIDSMASKAALVNHLKRSRFSFITSGGAGGKLSGMNVKTGDLAAAEQDPLLSRLREILREQYGFTATGSRKFGIRCVYIPAPRIRPADVNTPGEMQELYDCAGEEVKFGTSMAVTAALGLALAGEMIRRILASAHQ